MRKVFVFLVSLAFAVNANSQLLGSLRLDPKDFIQAEDSTHTDTHLLKEAVSSAFFIFRQGFQVREKATGQLYGLNGNKEFGVSYTVGVRIQGGCCLTDEAMRPYRYDARFGDYSDEYDAVMNSSSYTELTEKAVYDTVVIEAKALTAMADSVVYELTTDAFGGNGFTLDTAKGKKDGWMVWLVADENADLDKTAVVHITTYKKPLDVGIDDKAVEVDTPSASSRVLGGVYVVPVVSGIGVLHFQLCGVAVRDASCWCMTFPFLGRKGTACGATKANRPAELTPVEPGNKTVRENKKKRRK